MPTLNASLGTLSVSIAFRMAGVGETIMALITDFAWGGAGAMSLEQFRRERS